MIKLELENAHEIEKWFAGEVMPIVKSKIRTEGPGFTNNYSKQYLAELKKDDTLRDLLTMKTTDLEDKYEWIKEYSEVVHFVSEYDDYIDYYREAFKKEGLSHWNLCAKYEELRTDYWDDYSANPILNAYYSSYRFNKGILDSNAKMKAFIKHVETNFDKVNKEIAKIINYDFFDVGSGKGRSAKRPIKAEFVKKLGIRVCPYCNQQFVFYLGDSRYLGDLDHVRPKSKYALFAMSLYNLVPACKPCNQLFKKSSTKQFFNPYERGFDDDVYLHLRYRSVREIVGIDPISRLNWRLLPGTDPVANKLLRNEIELFKLNELYKEHAKEIRDTLKRRNDWDSKYRKCIRKLLKFTDLTDPRIVYGISFDPAKYQNEFMSRAISDIVWKN